MFLLEIWDFYKSFCIAGFSLIITAMLLGISVEVKSLQWKTKNK